MSIRLSKAETRKAYGRSNSRNKDSSRNDDCEEFLCVLIPIGVTPLRELKKEEEVGTEKGSLPRVCVSTRKGGDTENKTHNEYTENDGDDLEIQNIVVV